MHVTSTQKSSVMIAVYAWSAGTVMSDLNPEHLDVMTTLKIVRLVAVIRHSMYGDQMHVMQRRKDGLRTTA
jgi:hypothetical protein